MSDSEDPRDDTEGEAGDTAVAEAPAEEGPPKLALEVEVDDIGPCRKHVKVTVPRSEIDFLHADVVSEFEGEAEVPGFRRGHVPAALIQKRFKNELADQVKQRVLVGSLEQIAEEHELDPISEPDIDVETLDIPDEGDFVYEFEVEVRPKFDLPDFSSIEIERPVRTVTDEDVDKYREEFLDQYAEIEPKDGPAEKGDQVELSFEFQHDGKTLNRIAEVHVEVNKILRFRDAELEGFDELLAGAEAGDARQAEFVVSQQAERIEMRGETVSAVIAVMDVSTRSLPKLDGDFLERIGVESAEELNNQIRGVLERQLEFEQRQSARKQVLEKITDSANWELPERLVMQQTENALRREILEMQQAGYTTQQIRARENRIRQQAVTETEQALKEHFVLDRVATTEEIQTEPEDVDREIVMMAMQRGESPRRVRARLVKSGMIENLDAQIRERKAVDFILSKVTYKDIETPAAVDEEVSSLPQSICGMQTGAAAATDEDDADED
jgi:trigger factor